MFLFSGIFFPVSQLPGVVRWILQIVPLYHAVELLRALTVGSFASVLWWHFLYLVVGGIAAFAVALRRLERTLIK
jgi:lipooligosaccharide transport system permease protein